MRLRIATRIIEELSKADGLSAEARSIYVVSMFRELPSMRALASATNMSFRTVVGHVKRLEDLGWMRISKDGALLRPVPIIPAAVETALAAETLRLINLVPYRGEESTKRFIDWAVAPRVRLVYNARPQFLENAKTGHRLELDIYLPDFATAFEYQGDQHFGPTQLYPGEKEFIERYRRDLQKASLCRKSQIRLFTVTKYDLSLDKILAAIPPDVPRRAIDPGGPYVQMLEKIGRELAGTQELDRE